MDGEQSSGRRWADLADEEEVLLARGPGGRVALSDSEDSEPPDFPPPPGKGKEVAVHTSKRHRKRRHRKARRRPEGFLAAARRAHPPLSPPPSPPGRRPPAAHPPRARGSPDIEGFYQGCPSTLGANRRNADFFERVPARDKQVRDLFNERIINQIERDVGCKIRMDEKFLFVNGKDRLILAKGVDAVHKIIQGGKGKHSPSSPKPGHSRSPVRNTRSHSPRNSDSHRTRSPGNTLRSQSKGYYNERHLDGCIHNNMPKFSKGTPQAQAHANFGAKGRPSQSESPRHTSYLDEFPRTHGENNQFAASRVPINWGMERHGADACSSLRFDMPSHQHTLEELEMEFKREATQLARARDQEEDEENSRHRETMRVISENYKERVITMRNVHARKWEEFLDTFKSQQQAQPSYVQTGYLGFEQRTAHISATHQPMDSKNTYPYASDCYSAPKAHAAYGEFQHERHGDLGRPYRRY